MKKRDFQIWKGRVIKDEFQASNLDRDEGDMGQVGKSFLNHLWGSPLFQAPGWLWGHSGGPDQTSVLPSLSLLWEDELKNKISKCKMTTLKGDEETGKLGEKWSTKGFDVARSQERLPNSWAVIEGREFLLGDDPEDCQDGRGSMSNSPVARQTMACVPTWKATVLGVPHTQGSGRDKHGHIDPSRPDWDFCSPF